MKKKGDEVIAFDIGGTSMRAAKVSGTKISDYYRMPTPLGRREFLENIKRIIREFGLRGIRGIGIGIAGPVKNGKIMNAPNLVLKNFNLKRHIERKFKVRCEVGNDAGCFTLAEVRLGGKTKDFILITLGTGIGGGICVRGEPYRGSGYGAEFGHIYIRGVEWESLWKKTRKRIEREFGKGTLVSDLARKKDLRCRRVLEEAADYLGEGIASLISAFDPEVVFIGGGVRESGNYFIELIRKSVKKYSFLPKKTPIRWTTSENPGILGASLLID